MNSRTLIIVNNKLLMTHLAPEDTLVHLDTTVVNLEASEEWHFSSKDQGFMESENMESEGAKMEMLMVQVLV